MKERLLVMNGQRIVQHEQGGQWLNDKVGSAGPIRPGIYNLFNAGPPDKTKEHDGLILHTDKDSVYQQVGKNYIKHARAEFDKIPEIGTNSRIKYDQGKAIVSAAPAKLSRGLSR
jgi:cell filamentation protein